MGIKDFKAVRIAWVPLQILLLSGIGLAADAPPKNAAPKTVPPKNVEMLFVQNAKKVSLDKDKGKMTLKDIGPTTLFFSDRPQRIAGHMTTEEMIPLWTEGKDSFAANPPNATLSVFGDDGKVSNVVVELRNPKLEGTNLSYDVRVLNGQVPANGGSSSLFIDVIVVRTAPVVVAPRRAVIYGPPAVIVG